ncbi:MAG: hypothetical protein RL171_2032, partial [Pseudomonadota bacterium]
MTETNPSLSRKQLLSLCNIHALAFGFSALVSPHVFGQTIEQTQTQTQENAN